MSFHLDVYAPIGYIVGEEENMASLFARILRTLMIVFIVMGGGYIWGEEKTPTFQTSQDDFSTILQRPVKTSPKQLQTKGLSIKKGPAAIVEDYQKLVENPTARSLILFDFDSDRIKPESFPILENLAAALREQLPEIRLVIAGHTDAIGTDTYNLKLSQRRADAVRHVLIERYRIASERLIAQGYGESQPLAANENAQTRAQNRRVEFIRIE